MADSAAAEKKGKTARRRRLSITNVDEEAVLPGGGAEEAKETSGEAGGTEAGKKTKGGRRRRLSIVGLYDAIDVTEQETEETEAGEADPDAPQTNVISAFGYTSNAGYEPTGHKKTNQDSFCILEDFANVPNQYVFGVFDGHGRQGHKASNFVSSQFEATFAAKTESAKNVSSAFKQTFVDLDRSLGASDIDVKMSGTTGCVVFVRGDQLYTANAGDSRAILATMDDGALEAVELTFDQKPDLPEEKKRIEASGGIVEPIVDPYEGPVGPFRVWVKRQVVPGLAMARSIGDQLASTVGVCADPVVNSFKIDQNDMFLIVASDGIWEFMSNEEVIEIMSGYLDNPQKGCDLLCSEAYKRWKAEEYVVDDITAIVCVFDQAALAAIA